ncbi:EF-hand domain-containing protein, partial [Escherichia coli]|nr:EF-hand domain-containing protein [Escherichia coli]
SNPSSNHTATMLRFIATLLLISSACAQLHSVCHSNIHGRTEEEVIAQWAELVDRNHDGTVTTQEFVYGFSIVIGTPLPVDEAVILGMNEDLLLALGNAAGFRYSKHDFVQAWHQYFHDSIDFIESVFDFIDTNHNGFVDMAEVEEALNLMRATSDADHDGVLQVTEFIHFYTLLYSC